MAFNGTALSATGDQSGLADSLLHRYRTGGSASLVDALGGSYNVVAISPEMGLRAFPDFTGLFPLYWGQGKDFAVISNRSMTVAKLFGEPKPDLRAHAWIIANGSLFGDTLPVQGVSHVKPGTELQAAWDGGRVQVGRGPTWAWPDASEGEGRSNLTDAEWSDVTASLVSNFQALSRNGEPLRLRLTGGKDSRLCLALALAAGLRDDIQTITTGPHDSPEVEVAAAVARAAGVPHERIGPPAPDPNQSAPDDGPSAPPPAPPFDPAPVWQKMRQGIYRYEGIVCAWSALMNPTRPPMFGIKGFGGEFYRRGNARQRQQDTSDLDALAESFLTFQQLHDPLQVLRPAETEFQREWMRRWVYSTAEEVRVDLLPEKLYVDYRLSHWTGVLLQSTPVRIDVNPLLSRVAVGKNLELSASARGAERFHFEVMRNAYPDLVKVPFLNDTWVPEIHRTSPVELPSEPYPVTVTPQRPRNWGNPGWPLLENEQEAIERLFKEAKSKTDMKRICDMRNLKKLALRAETVTRGASVKELFSCIGTALTLLGRTDRIVDDP